RIPTAIMSVQPSAICTLAHGIRLARCPQCCQETAMRNHPPRAMYDQLEDTLTAMTMQLRSAIAADARQLSAELASVLLDTLGLAGTIEWHVRQYQKCTGILCELAVSSVAGFDLPDDYAVAIF